MITVSLEGLQSGIAGEERALALIKVAYRFQVYDWQIYIPPETELGPYIESQLSNIYADIDRKEAEWEALDPATRPDKSEIVRPDVPDYYAKRRAEYPPLGEQLDAIWKGGAAQNDMFDKILAVKQKYPKP